MTPAAKNAYAVLEEYFEPFVAADHPDQAKYARARIAWRTLRSAAGDDARTTAELAAVGVNTALELESTKKLAGEISALADEISGSTSRAMDHLRGATKRDRPPIPEDR